ncbi:hypothetical protein [Thermus sp. CCB_US3_UF1]|uniref:hypothetical protein n=1 Tax=Thermus sp. CCB_US3_UF1 TaxID=1111069 RepID=UPI0018C8CDA7|nr:hypothetical protein [Thermus sp. CCB_US3_UF1]
MGVFEAIRDLLMLLFTLVLSVAAWQQARTTRAMKELQEKLTDAETNPALSIRTVYPPWRIQFANLAKYGIEVVEVNEPGSESAGRRFLRPSHFPLVVMPGQVSEVPLEVPNLSTLPKPESLLQGRYLLEVYFRYGGQPALGYKCTYVLYFDRETSYYKLVFQKQETTRLSYPNLD